MYRICRASGYSLQGGSGFGQVRQGSAVMYRYYSGSVVSSAGPICETSCFPRYSINRIFVL